MTPEYPLTEFRSLLGSSELEDIGKSVYFDALEIIHEDVEQEAHEEVRTMHSYTRK